MKYISLIALLFFLTGCGGGSSENPPVVRSQPAVKVEPLQRFHEIQSDYASGNRPIIRVLGLGSSVGNGASLSHPETDAPVAHFTQQLISLGYEATFVNLSVNGSVMIEGSTQFASLKENFDIVLIVYGMNDGAPYHYSAGQTVNGFEHEMTRIAEKIYLSGADPIFVTTPHPNTHRIDWTMPENPIVPWTGPDYSCSPCYSIRHKNINDILRNSPYPVIDAGAEWIKAVDMFGEDYLFDPGEYVHPNLIGHQLSFWAAIDQWLLNQ